MNNSKLTYMVNQFPHQVLEYLNESKGKDFLDVWRHFKVNTSIVGDAIHFLQDDNLIEESHYNPFTCQHQGYVLTEKGVNILNQIRLDSDRLRLGSLFDGTEDKSLAN